MSVLVCRANINQLTDVTKDPNIVHGNKLEVKPSTGGAKASTKKLTLIATPLRPKRPERPMRWM
jgi:hypothetical protein